MYKMDQAKIARFSKKSPDNTARVVKFVLLTIQRKLELVGPIMRGECGVGLKRVTERGIEYAEAHKIELHAAIHGPGLTTRERMLAVLAVPGLGIVKSAFVLQLCAGLTGCLDRHNLVLYGLNEKDFRANCAYGTLIKRVDAYLEICERLGGSERLWDAWCDYVATQRPGVFANGDAVSKEHVSAIIF